MENVKSIISDLICFFFKLTVATAHGQSGVSAAKLAVQGTKSDPGTVIIRGLQTAGKTAPCWVRHVKHSCANLGPLVMVSNSWKVRV